jgi:hypothetical protein
LSFTSQTFFNSVFLRSGWITYIKSLLIYETLSNASATKSPLVICSILQLACLSSGDARAKADENGINILAITMADTILRNWCFMIFLF